METLPERLSSSLEARFGRDAMQPLQLAGLPPALLLEANPHTRIALVILDGSIGPREMTLRIRGYFDHGMHEVWLIDPADQTVELWNTPWQPLQLSDDDSISSPLLPGFSLPLLELFA
ncbi:MAG: hypothetical protein RL328_2093 [Acidobacteriota bacterium]|jgi:hypothetical protein